MTGEQSAPRPHPAPAPTTASAMLIDEFLPHYDYSIAHADIVRAHPGRILAVYIREVRLDPGDGRVEKVSGAWSADVPFVLAADSAAVRRHATELGLL